MQRPAPNHLLLSSCLWDGVCNNEIISHPPRTPEKTMSADNNQDVGLHREAEFALPSYSLFVDQICFEDVEYSVLAG